MPTKIATSQLEVHLTVAPVMTFLGRSELVLPKQTAEVQWRENGMGIPNWPDVRAALHLC